MAISRRFALQAVAGLFVVDCRSLLASDFWDTEAPDKWTSGEIEELTTKSPWAKAVTAEVKAYAPLGNSRGSSRRGGMQTTGRAGAGSPSVDSPKFPGVVRWASAKPILLALKQKLPEELAGHFVISVSGLPIVSGHGGEAGATDVDTYEGLKAQTSLQVKGQKAVPPDVIQTDRKETSTIYFGFLPQIVQLDGDKTVTFETTMDPLRVKVKFETKQMKFKGDLAV